LRTRAVSSATSTRAAFDLRGETFARFASEFDVLDRFKAIRLRRS